MDATLENKHRRMEAISKIYSMAMRYKDDNKLLANFCLETGTSLRVAKEYLKLLKDSGRLNGTEQRRLERDKGAGAEVSA